MVTPYLIKSASLRVTCHRTGFFPPNSSVAGNGFSASVYVETRVVSVRIYVHIVYVYGYMYA